MSRLIHSNGGFRRALQISKARVHAFVEGGPDRSFVDSVLRSVCGTVPYQIIVAKELPQNTGGKAPLLNLFNELRGNDQLDFTGWEKRAVCIFFLDKDIDDLTGDTVDSEHVIYTETYDLEGHLIESGDLIRAIAFSSYITTNQALQFLGDKDDFLEKISASASHWLALCIISKRRGLNIACNFSRQIPVNQYAEPLQNDLVSLGEYIDEICNKAAISRDEFDAEFSEVELSIQQSLQSGQPLRYFKGKWYRKIFQDLAQQHINIEDANFGSLGENIIKILISHISPETGCQSSARYAERVNLHLARMNGPT